MPQSKSNVTHQEYKIPKDNDSMTKKYLVEKGGICGQACLAVIENTSIQKVLKRWKGLGLEWKGWSGWRQLSSYLKKRNYLVKQSRNMRNPKAIYIARIQWIGEGEKKDRPFFGWGHWTEASSYTHFILIIPNENKFFCNENGWYSLDDLSGYLEKNKGIVTSYLEIEREIDKSFIKESKIN